jgi:hypothetical protein
MSGFWLLCECSAVNKIIAVVVDWRLAKLFLKNESLLACSTLVAAACLLVLLYSTFFDNLYIWYWWLEIFEIFLCLFRKMDCTVVWYAVYCVAKMELITVG